MCWSITAQSPAHNIKWNAHPNTMLCTGLHVRAHTITTAMHNAIATAAQNEALMIRFTFICLIF